MYGANTGTKLHLALAGTMERSGNGFAFYIDLPNATGVPVGTALPPIVSAIPANDNTFTRGGARLDLQADIAFNLKGDAAGQIPQLANYSSATVGTSVNLTVTAPAAGTAVAFPAAATVGTFSKFAGGRVAYKDSPDGKVLTNPGNANGGGVGSLALELELDRTALGLPSGASIVRVFGAYISASGFWSSDVIPEVLTGTTPNSSNFAFDPDFTQEAGTQAATFNVVLGTKQADEASVAMSVFPNPSNSQATVTYRVLNGAEYVNVVLTDLMGRTVRTLQDGKQAAGFQNIGLNSSTIAAGTYMVRVQVGDKVATRKVVLL
ncbi:hypothetical protein GCM10022407_12330 [Hymenobacter antarcticus]|uniref:Secretion system C-terminal sorting domain-containing protein n=2 Tax=Hymenobacter antarcticus TaxID=486270 RepID=A0ABP7PM45_9BACT